MKTYGDMSEEKIGGRWDASLSLLFNHYGTDKDWIDERYGVGVVTRATKHFLPGDVVILMWWNGSGERQRCWSRTRRGRSIKGLYVEYGNFESFGHYDVYNAGDRGTYHRRATHHRKTRDWPNTLLDNALIHVFEPPPSWDDWPSPVGPTGAAVRRYVVESTRAWHAGRWVGASTPATSMGDEVKDNPHA